MKQITIIWSTEDVLLKAERLGIKLDETEADNILDDLGHYHDADIGICWDVIASYIYQYEEERKETNLANDLYERAE